jgi:glycosyltransferase involved in cell wall biosynthesis
MRVLMLGWELPPHNSGGLGVACYQLCKALSHNGVAIEFILPYELKEPVGFMQVHAAQPYDVVEVTRSGGAYDSYLYHMRDGTVKSLDVAGQQQLYEHGVARLVEKLEFDVIHAHDWLTFRAGVRAKAATGRPLILHVHSIESDRAGGEPGNPLVREIEELSMLMADRVLAVSNHTKKAIVREYRVPADKIEVVHNSIDSTALEPLDKASTYRYLERMKSLGYHVITNVGRITVQKGLPNLLRAAKEVIAREPKTIFLIVGAGEQYYELIELAASLGISQNVLFAGFQRGKRWRDAFGIADLFVMPSISEPFGLTPLEAAGFGVPSLITKQSGVAEILHNCLKVDYWDVNKMADQIVSVIRHKGLHDELAHNVRHEFNRLSWDNAATHLQALYRSHSQEVHA